MGFCMIYSSKRVKLDYSQVFASALHPHRAKISYAYTDCGIHNCGFGRTASRVDKLYTHTFEVARPISVCSLRKGYVLLAPGTN